MSVVGIKLPVCLTSALRVRAETFSSTREAVRDLQGSFLSKYFLNHTVNQIGVFIDGNISQETSIKDIIENDLKSR